jgi:RNA polymerase sigma factor (sigma-70 family)
MAMSTGGTASGVVPVLRAAPRGLLGDRRLGRLAAQGDAAAFEAIFRRHGQDLYRYCLAILRDAEEAQDALQSTMAAALRSLPHDQREIPLRPWLYRVAHNEAVSILRRRTPVVDPATAPESSVPGADTSAEARERLRGLVADLETLPERQRGALVMRELSDLTYAEIAEALGASEPAARQVVYEARVALRELEEGREMECEEAQRALSARDGRLLRGRRLRSHLRSCERCGDFRAAIEQRRSDLEALCPPLPAAAASGLLATLLSGTGSGGGGAVAGSAATFGAATTGPGIGAAGTTMAAAAGVKGAALAGALAIGAGAAGMTGVVDTPWTPERDRNEPADARSPADDREPGTGGRVVVPGEAASGTDTSEAGRALLQTPRPAEPGRPGDGSVAETPNEGALPGGPAGDERRADHPDQGDGPPAHAGAGGGPPAHANGRGEGPTDVGGPPAHTGPPAHAGPAAQGGPPADAGPPAQAGPPAHAGAGGGPPAHAGSGGGAPSQSSTGGSGAGNAPTGGGPPPHASSGAGGSKASAVHPAPETSD